MKLATNNSKTLRMQLDRMDLDGLNFGKDRNGTWWCSGIGIQSHGLTFHGMVEKLQSIVNNREQ